MDEETKFEILRIKDRLRNLEVKIRKLERGKNEYHALVDKLIAQDRLDKALEAAVKKHNKVYLSKAQRIGAGIIVVLTVAQSLKDLGWY